jgi:hypothetical protein
MIILNYKNFNAFILNKKFYNFKIFIFLFKKKKKKKKESVVPCCTLR